MTKLMNKIIKKLDINGIKMHGNTKFQGNVFLNDKFPEARLDITTIHKKEQIPYMLLHSTGSKDLIIKLNIIADKKGWKLSETKMTDENGENIIVDSEKDVFRLLGIKYLKPKDR